MAQTSIHRSSSPLDYVLHLRPRSWPIVALHALVGAILAWLMGMPVSIMNALAGAIIWAVFLNGGTLALNSAIDCDDGDIGYLDNPPKPPEGLKNFGAWMMVIGAACAMFINQAFFFLYVFNVLLSYLYSVPPARFKAKAGPDVCINALGYGLSTFLSGWLSQTGSVDAFALMIGVGFAFLFSGFYPFTQIYQYEEDRASGAHTLSVALGPEKAVTFAAVFIHAAFIMFLTGFILSGRILVPLILLGLAWMLWRRLLVNWPLRKSQRQQKAGMYEALYIWALTDCLILLSALG